ncbi:MAG: monovalent cation/H(+) antiporter subunit G [Clostridia bacterium]|nr:monovalent cation/H(+) antiporter subunit G [Clostridia bacterium]
MNEWILFALTTAFVLVGLVFCCIGVFGLFKFKYAGNRMHAAAVVDTMGISMCMLGFAISAPDLFSGLKILLVIVFWWLSSPVASHLLCRLEITTNDQRDEYMTVHGGTLQQERTAAEASAQETNEEAAAEETEAKEEQA